MKLFNQLKSNLRWGSLLKKLKIPLIFLAIILLFENLLLGFNSLQNKMPVLGLKINNQQISTLGRPQVEEVIKKEIEKINYPLRLSYQGRVFEVKKEEVGAVVNPTEQANEIIEEGRKGSFLQKIIDQNKALLGLKDIKVKGEISQALLNLKILSLKAEIDVEAKPPMPNFTGDLSKTVPAKDGIKINSDKLTVIIADNIFNPPKEPIEIPVIKTFLNHQISEIEPFRKSAQQLTADAITIASGGLIFTLTPQDLKSLLTLVERSDPKNPKKLVLSLRLDDVGLNKKLGEFAAKVEQVTGAEFDDHDARVAIYAQFNAGRRKTINIPTGRRLLALAAKKKEAVEKRVLGEKTGPKVAYLTFDDGPNSTYHPLILDILKKYNIKATFFLVGQNAQKDLEVAKRTASEGHIIANHSLTHSFLPNLSSKLILNELKNTKDILRSVNNDADIKFFRPPYGGVNLYVKKTAEDLGLKMFLWDVDPRDWSEPPVDELIRRVVSATFDGADILLHSNHLVTAQALPKIIENLQAQGYVFDQLH